MSEQIDPIDIAVRDLGWKNSFNLGEQATTIVALVRQDDWRSLKAPWWRGKEVCVIGADLHGNFFLRHCDGSVRYWNHQEQRDFVVATSVKEFVRRIEQQT